MALGTVGSNSPQDNYNDPQIILQVSPMTQNLIPSAGFVLLIIERHSKVVYCFLYQIRDVRIIDESNKGIQNIRFDFRHVSVRVHRQTRIFAHQ